MVLPRRSADVPGRQTAELPVDGGDDRVPQCSGRRDESSRRGWTVLCLAEQLQVTPLRRDEVLYASANPEHTQHPVTIEQVAAARLILYDAHYGWRDPTRRQLAERAQLAGVVLTARIEVEHVDSALDLVARGAGDTIVSTAVASGPSFPAGLHTTSFADPLYDTIALVQRSGAPLSPATRELARLARRMLLEEGTTQDPRNLLG